MMKKITGTIHGWTNTEIPNDPKIIHIFEKPVIYSKFQFFTYVTCTDLGTHWCLKNSNITIKVQK
jgi:hypothetical protein